MAEVNTIFIVDDDKAQTEMMKDYLSNVSSFNIHTFNSGEECLKNLNLNPQIIFLDYNFDLAPGFPMDGLDILKEIKEKRPDIEVVMISGQDKIEVAVNTMKYGAFDYIVKSESAFHRAQNAIMNVIRRMKIEGEARRYKKLTYSFGIAFAIMLVVAIILYKTGHIKDSPGWF